jgi:pimeloyl-ACP methyl ester carboxylesterase
VAAPGVTPQPQAFTIASAQTTLAGEELTPDGAGATVVLLHGLTATRRYVVHRSRVLPRSGHRTIAFDARGHGESGPAPDGSYGYEQLAADVEAVLKARVGEGRVVLAGHSMGAHTAATLALDNPERVAAAVFIGPAVTGMPPSAETLAYWDRLADGLERGGVDGFLEAYDRDLDPAWRETVLRFTRERLEAHRHPEAVAQAIREVPRSLPFEGLSELEFLDVPALVVASNDEADPGHPRAISEAWAESLPQAALISEEPGQSPLAWQGGRVSRAIADFCATDAVRERLAR